MTGAAPRSLADFPDILYDVFAYLDPSQQIGEESVYDCRRSLAVSARTCRQFTIPALSMLWKRLPDDQPLADLLCALGIVSREPDPEGETFNEVHRPRRYRLPNQRKIGLRIPGVVEEYELLWRKRRGYDLEYVRNVLSPMWRLLTLASLVHTSFWGSS